MVSLDDFLQLYLGVAFVSFYLKRPDLALYTDATNFNIGISVRFIFFTAVRAWAGAPSKSASCFSSLFCASFGVIVSFMLVSSTIPHHHFCENKPRLHGKLNPMHRHIQNACLMFPRIIEVDPKCQVYFLKNRPRRQNKMLHNV